MRGTHNMHGRDEKRMQNFSRKTLRDENTFSCRHQNAEKS